jgi:phage tail-like protein
MAIDVLDTIFGGTSPLNHRFGLIFLHGGVLPNPLDIRFQSVSGLNTTLETQRVREGGNNFYEQQLPVRVKHDNLILKRGYPLISPLSISVNETLAEFKFYTSHVLLTALDLSGLPVTAWLFERAYPVKWSFSDFDADGNAVIIETLELAFASRKKFPI